MPLKNLTAPPAPVKPQQSQRIRRRGWLFGLGPHLVGPAFFGLWGLLAASCSVLAIAAPQAASAAELSATEVSEIRRQINELRAQQEAAKAAQLRIEASLASLESKLGAAPPAPPAAPSPVAGPVPAPPTPPPASRFSVSGDLRLRLQGDISDKAPDRYSGQIRVRLGASYKLNDLITVAGRIATGDPDDPNSTDVQISNFADDLTVSLDQAYVQVGNGEAKLFLGKFPQPFTRTDLVWDSDVNPQGAAATYAHKLGDSRLRAGAMFFLVDEQAVGGDSTMWGAQLGYDVPAGRDLKFDLSASYLDYQLGSVAGADAGDFRSNLRNAAGGYLSDFNLADVIVGATWSGLGPRWPLRVAGDFVRNLGARTSEDTGYSIDLSAGRLARPGDWRVGYNHAMAETDAVLAAFSHDNIALGTNYELHGLTLDYMAMPGAVLTAIWYHYRPHVAPAADDAWQDRFRLSLTTSF